MNLQKVKQKTMQEQPNTTDEHVGSIDDTHVMRYLLHTIKGISPVSGSPTDDMLVPEYIVDEDTVE